MNLRYLQIANTYFELGRYEEAREIAKSLMDKYDHSEAIFLYGKCSDDPYESIEYYKRAIEKASFSPHYHWELGQAYIRVEEYGKAWPELEWRLDLFPELKEMYRQYLICKSWQGQGLRGKKVNVVTEQGIGDNLLFLRFLPLLKKLGCEISLSCDASLHSLVEGQCGIDNVIGNVWSDYDYQMFLLSLPYLLECDKPPTKPYLDAPKADIRCPGFKIGLCWSGNAKYGGDCWRSTYLSNFRLLHDLPGTTLFSFVKNHDKRAYSFDPEPVHLSEGHPDMRLISLDLQDWRTTASYLKAMDLVVSVDTGLLNLAGALGVPAIGVLFYKHDPRWGTGSVSKLYPSVQLARQRGYGDWDSAIAQAVELAKAHMA